jgi:lysophospholipase L1-like esterase
MQQHMQQRAAVVEICFIKIKVRGHGGRCQPSTCHTLSAESAMRTMMWLAVGLWSGLAMAQSNAAKAGSALPVKPVTIVLVGDSTTAAEGGWGPGFCAFMTPNVTCLDDALNGRSSKSFRDEGAWKKALAQHGDYYLIQFGHNDQKPNPDRHTDPETTFAAQLKQYVAEVRAIGAVPVIVTPLSRRTFVDGRVKEDLNDYAAAARRVATEEGITCIDLNAMSTKLLDTMTQAQADEFDAVGHADAKAENAAPVKLDRTHLNDKGKAVFGRMVLDALVETHAELGPDVAGASAAAGK